MLGNGFPLEKVVDRRSFIIGGGIGLPPLLETAKHIRGEKNIILGYRNSDTFLLDEFCKCGNVTIATEDG